MPHDTKSTRRVNGTAIGLLVLSVLAGLVAVLPTPAAAATYSLYGSASQGWGLTSTTITSPGPLLMVNRGEVSTLDLYAADFAPHTWCIDYNANHACDGAAENVSATFTSPTVPVVHQFVPTGAAGTYNYICGVHGDTVMVGPIRIATGALRPSVSISSPTGLDDWTGGSTHRIWWNMSSTQDPVTSLTVFVNYTIGANTFRIAGPIPGIANPNWVPWTLPLANTTVASVNVTAIDTQGRHGWDVRLVPTIDSAPPSVATRFPANGAAGVSTTTDVIVTFSEAMNPTATEAPGSTALQDTVTMGYVAVTRSWNTGNTVLTMHPVAALLPSRMYRAFANVSALDASDPGNNLAASMWVFTTGSGADLTPPQISGVTATPPVAEYGAATNVTATITDDVSVASAYVNVTFPDASRWNHSMAQAAGNEWAWANVYPLLGNYLFRVEAVDPSGNWNRSASGTFTVRDTTAPVIGTPTVSPSPAEVYNPVNISVSVTEPFLQSVRINVTGILNETMDWDVATSTWFKAFTPSNVGTFAFNIRATDTRGNAAAVSGSLTVADTTPPPVPQSLQATIFPGGGAVQLDWAGVSAPDLAGYRVYRASSPSGPFAQLGGPVSGTTYTDRSVEAGATYYYRVTAVDLRDLESGPSSVVPAVLPGAEADWLPVIAATGVIVVAVLVVMVLLLRRRRKAP